MSAMTRPRGPLPQRVYWVRRAVVLAGALAVVVLIASLFNLASNGSDDADDTGATARRANAEVKQDPALAEKPGATAESSTDAGSTTPTPSQTPTPTLSPSPTPTPLAQPSGPCAPDDVLVTPAVSTAIGGSPVTLDLDLTTRTAEACTWQVSPATLTLKITSGTDDVWLSRECRNSVPTQDVVVRREVPTPVTATWNARRSDAGCSHRSAWARAGWYHVSAAALGGEPATQQFRLRRPVPVTVTVTPKPTKQASPTKQARPTKPAKSPTHTPSGAVEPNG